MSRIVTLALVGRPNVGKSTLFNRLAKKRASIVHDQPGVTRDRNIEFINYQGVSFMLIDTGGFEPDPHLEIQKKMREQSQLAVEEADAIIFLLDRTSGWNSQDKDVYDFLRRSKKKIFFTVNKVDSEKHEMDVAEYYESGVDEVFSLSAEHGVGVAHLLDSIAQEFPEVKKDDSEEEERQITISLVGRPNAGKSSLANQLIGEKKHIVHDEPGTTRDPVNSYFKYHGETFKLVDTAGIRRKSKVSHLVDKFSMVAALKMMEESDVVLLLVDAKEGVVEQDARIAGYAIERGKGIIIVVNKWDLIEKDGKTMNKMTQDIRDELPFLTYAPIEFISAKTGQRVTKILETVKEVYKEFTKRIQTSDVNQILETILARHQPPRKSGRATKIFFGSQVSIKPPKFVFSTNNPEAINVSFERYMEGQLRHYFGFEGTPVRVRWKKRESNTKDKEA